MIMFTLDISFTELQATPESVLAYELALHQVAEERREAAMRSAESQSGRR